MTNVPIAISMRALADSIAASGLVPPEELSPVVAAARDDPQELARILTEQKLLTRFQIQTLIEGRGASLRVGNYDVVDRLGAGAMGTVFKARHRRMKRIVALKVLAARHSKNPVFVKRFQREVETIASLGHPNVVMAYDADEAEIGHFLVMEFVQGRDLAACVETEGAFPITGAISCILQAAMGLSYAHSQGIIHRDIKPHNLMLDNAGVVKVTDLGLARLTHGMETGADVTMAGGVVGTADYMPPEQALDSSKIDHRADIYSLGCTLYFLLVTQPPYSGSSILSILLEHREAEIPSIRKTRPDAPPRLEALLRRMMAKHPDDRPQSMAEVIDELKTIAAMLPADHTATAQTLDMSSFVAQSSLQTLSKDLSVRTLANSLASDLSVLVVEPSRVQASIIKGYLQEQGHSVAALAANGADAIEAVRRHRPRAVVSTMHLPDMNGVQLAERIRADFKVNAPGFVLVSSESSDSDSAELGRLSRLLLLPKPFTPVQLTDALNQVTGASAAFAGSAVPPQKRDRSQLKIMIVDDSATARINVRNVLQGLGFSQFTEVTDGAHAIAVAAREICDLIVTDYNMPLMDGRALVSYLKQNPPTAAIPIIMFTTETDPKVLDPVRAMGVIAVIEKAFPASVVGPLLDSLF